MNRGDVYDVDWPGAGRHPAVIVTRQVAIEVLNSVAVILVTSRIRGIRTEVPLGEPEGLDHECVGNCDNILTVPKKALGRHRGSLGLPKLDVLNRALKVALELD